MSYFVICERQEQYNDEIYYFEEGEGGKPVSVHTKLEKANDKLRELTHVKLRDCELSSFCYDIKDLDLPDDYDDPDVFSSLGLIGSIDDRDVRVSPTATDEQLDALMKRLKGNLDFYQVFEV
jgi:hypothetical protein